MEASVSQVSYSEDSRPQTMEGKGSGRYCCVPTCRSTQYTKKGGEKTSIGFFKFPKDPVLRKRWLSIILRFRRKGGADGFNANNAVICEFHFKPEDIKVSLGVGRKTLQGGAIPSIFKFRQSTSTPKRKSPTKRTFQTPSENVCNEKLTTEEMNVVEQVEDENDCSNCKRLSTDVEHLRKEIQDLRLQIEELQKQKGQLEQESERADHKYMYSYSNLSTNNDLFKSSTGLEVDSFDALFAFVNPGQNCENIKLSGDSKEKGGNSKYFGAEKPGPKPRLDAKNQFFMFLTWLRNGFPRSHVSWLFDIPKSTVSRYIISWTNFLYFSLGSVPIWPTKQQVMDSMPETFKTTYPSTRCIIDCTELFCQKPSALATQSALYSQYKHHVTYKGLLGIAPSGAITFISELFDGSISDKEIVVRSGLLEPRLWSKEDSVMADRGFTIKAELDEIAVSLNIPSFLSGRSQLTEEEVKESQAIASVRIHVERAIARIKKFRQIKNEYLLYFMVQLISSGR